MLLKDHGRGTITGVPRAACLLLPFPRGGQDVYAALRY